ncbi:unnamed protein product [Mucor hiemalis]
MRTKNFLIPPVTRGRVYRKVLFIRKRLRKKSNCSKMRFESPLARVDPIPRTRGLCPGSQFPHNSQVAEWDLYYLYVCTNFILVSIVWWGNTITLHISISN